MKIRRCSCPQVPSNLPSHKANPEVIPGAWPALLSFSFFLHWVITAACRLSFAAQGLSLAAVHGGFYCCRAWALEHMGSIVAVHGLSCPVACGTLVPQPGMEPVSPALEG